MSNGVGVIVRGHKTAHIGFDKTPILPHRISNRPITLPPYTVSRQFHLIESPGRPLNNAISHLLHSIVRSASPALVTKTMLTTFTYLTTVLRHSNTIVKSREETVSNVVTQKYRPTMEYTPSVKAEPSSVPPELLASITGSSNYFTDTLTTTYLYLNTFTIDALPVILTSRETVTNVVTLPIYMSPTVIDLMVTGSKVYETETYFTTYTFSKTMLISDAASEVITTKEVITQVVITEALAPPTSQGPMNTPILPTDMVSMDEITKTYLTTFTHLFTELDDSGQIIIRSSTSISSDIVTEKVAAIDSTETVEPDPILLKIKMTAMPTITGWIGNSPSLQRSSHITMRSPGILIPTRSPEFQDPVSFTTIQPSITIDPMEPKTLEPVMIYATKTYYTTFTYFTTVLADGTRTKASVQSRTEIISKVVTEALSTSFNAYYLNALKSSYLSKHSTMIDITSSVREVTPAKTFEATERPGTLITQAVSHPHWPKDNDELAVEVDGTTINSIDGVEIQGNKENPVQAEIQVSSASSEEHFDEVKDEISHIVNVLTDQAQGSEESPTSALAPSPTQQPIYSTTVPMLTPESVLTTSQSTGLHGVGYVEQVHFDHSAVGLSDELHDFAAGFQEGNSVLPVSHIPTPPLEKVTTKSPMQTLTTSKPKTKRPLNPYTTGIGLDLFPDIGPPLDKSTMIDLPLDISEYSYEDKDYSSLLMADRYPHSTSVLAKRTGTMVFEPVSPVFKNPSDQIINLMSSLADGQWTDYEKEEIEEDIPPPNIYNIHTTFDSFIIPTKNLVPVPMKSPSVVLKFGTVSSVRRPIFPTVRLNSTLNGDEDGGDMKIHNLYEDDNLLDGSGSGSGESPLFIEEVIENEGSGAGSGYLETEQDYREEDHTTNPDSKEVEEADTEGFTKMTESPIPPFPPKTRYTTSRRPDKRKKTKRPIFGGEVTSKEQDSRETSTKVYSLKVPSFDLGAGGDSVSDESDQNNSEKKENSQEENDDISSESEETRPSNDLPSAPGPSKSSITFPNIGHNNIVHPAPGSGGSVTSPSSSFDWKPLLKLGAIGLGGLGASSLTKLSPWFNSMAGSLMKGSLLPLARNDTSSTQTIHNGPTGPGRPQGPIFLRHPPPHPNDDRDRPPPHQQHSDHHYIPLGNSGGDRHSADQDDRIPRRPITSHAKDPNGRPVSLERDRERYPPPGRGHPSSPYRDIGSDGNFPPKHNYNFQPPNDRLPNIYSLSESNVHKNGEYTSKDPNIRVINGPPLDVHHHSASDLPVEGKTEFILRPIQNILNGKPAFEGSPKPGPVIPLRPPPYRSSGERPSYNNNNRPHSNGDSRPMTPEFIDINDIPDLPPRKPVQEIPILRPVPPTEGIILPHRIRGEHGGNNHNQQRHPTNSEMILHALKRPFMPRPLQPFRQSEEILNMKPPGPIQSDSGIRLYSAERPSPHGNRPQPPPIHMSPPEMLNPFPPPPPQVHQQNLANQQQVHHSLETEASEENIFKDIFGIRPGLQNNFQNNYDTENRQPPQIGFHPHNAGEGPFRPLGSTENHPQQPMLPILNVPAVPVPHPTGIAGQPSNQFGQNEYDQSREESAENPFKHEFTKMNPTKKPAWPPLEGNAPVSYSYFEDNSHVNQPNNQNGQLMENEISSSHMPMLPPEIHAPQPPPLAFPPTPHIPPHRQRPSTVYIIQQEEMEAPTTTSTTPPPPPSYPPVEQDVGESVISNGDAHFTTEFPKLIIKEIPTRPVAPYYRRPSTTPTTPAAGQSNTNRATIAKLFIRRFSTTTLAPSTIPMGETTTASPPRFVTWRTRLRPTYVTTTTTTPPPPHRKNQTSTDTLIDSWLVSPTVNDLQEFLNDFKAKYNNSTSPNTTVGSNVYLPHKFSSSSSSTPRPQNLNDDDDLLSSEYEDDEFEDELSISAASSERNSSNVLHPNHHPVHKDPIDAEHFFSTGQGDFAQYYSGSEDRDTIIDPVNQQVIKSPFDSASDQRNNVSSIINRYRSSSTTTRPLFRRPVHFRNFTIHTVSESNSSPSTNAGEGVTVSLPNNVFGSSTPSENEITDLPSPTTYRPTRFDVTFHSKIGTTSEEPHQKPTTFRGDGMRPTTFRPGPEDVGNRVRPDPTRDLINSNLARPPSHISTTKRPAPQAGIASFYDDEDSMDQLKIKNKEIHKLPTHTKKPSTFVHDILDALSDELNSSEKSKLLVAASSVKSSKEKTTVAPTNKDDKPKQGDEYGSDGELYSDEYDSSLYEELDSYLEVPPAIPNKNNQDFAPAVVPSISKNSAEGKQNNQFVVHGTPPPPPHSRRPGPLEMLTNFFRRPQHPRPPPPNHPLAGGPGRLPFLPNSSREPTRTMLPPPLVEKRPDIEFQANAFNPHVKTIPLNPNAEKDSNKGNEPLIVIPNKEFTTNNPSIITTTIVPNRDSGEKTTLNPSVINFEDGKGNANDQAPQDSNTVTVNPNTNPNGHRESTYVEDSEYYEDEEMEEDDKNNVIPPEEDNTQQYTGPPIKFQPTLPPLHAVNKPHPENIRPITIGGHLFNNGNMFRPPTQSQRLPPPLPPGFRPPILHSNRSPIFNSPTLANLQHVPPLIQSDVPPPRTEMEPPPIESNRLKAPILELPSGGPIRYRPLNNNFHRPNNILEADDEKSQVKVSKTVHTIATVDELNKIIATNTFTAIIPTRVGSREEVHTTRTVTRGNIDSKEVRLEGSESSVNIPIRSTGSSVKMTSIIKYTEGRLETTEIGGTVTRGINIIPTRTSSIRPFVTTTSTSSNTRLDVLNRRPPMIIRQSTTSSSTSTEVTSSSSTSTSSQSSANPKNDTVRVTVTMESTVSSNEATADSSAQSINRRPFIPTRVPSTRNTNYPWLRKTTVTSISTETLPTTVPTTTSKTVSSLEKSTSYPTRVRIPTISSSSSSTTEATSKESSGFSTTLRHTPSIFNISRGNQRPDILRRTTAVPPKISPPATKPSKVSSSSSSKESSHVSMEVSSKTSSSTESKERPSYIFPPRSTTFRPPFRRPTLSFVSPSSPTLPKSRERFTTALINKVSTTSGTPSPTKNPSVFSGILTSKNFTTSPPDNNNPVGNNTSSTLRPLSGSEEYEYTDEEYEDEDFELDEGKGDNVSARPKVTTSDSKNDTTSNNNSRTVTTSSSMSVSTSMSIGNESRVITVSSSEISPTRVNNDTSNNNRANRPKGILNTMVLRGGITRVPDLPTITKYVTHSETETKTLTETETTVVVTAGTPYTHTIMITKTLPPQTLISTIVGSVTLVNSIDVKPTTVRSTIFAQPTKEVYSFVDTSEDLESADETSKVDENVSIVHRPTNGHGPGQGHGSNKVLHGGVLSSGAGSRPHRPQPTRPQTPPPNHIPKHELPPSTKEPKVLRNKPSSYDSGCSANCTNHGNQACRPYANGTKYKCECKPGYARLKRKFPCRPTYTYELTLAINQMDGMSFDFKDLQNSETGGYHSFITVSKEAIDKAFLSTDIKRQFQGSEIMKLRPVNTQNEKTKSSEPKVYVDFLVQLTANVTEDRIRNHLIRTLKSSNFSVGRTGISSTKNMTDFGARDFNECLYSEFNDCSPNAECINLRGSFSCRCRAGYRDKSPKKHKPGRDCFEMQGCPECNYKGHCRINAYGEPFCECFRWFGGSKCHINLKILLFAIMGVVAILFIFVLLCSVLVCRRTKIHRERPGSGRFMRYRSPTSQATLDRAAIMNDSASSDGRQSPPRINMHSHSFTPDSLVVEGDSKQPNSGGMRGDSLLGSGPDNVHLMNFSLRNVIMDQDRSLTVVIPRAKIKPPSRPPSIHATLGPDTSADLAANERKLINYLDHSPYPPAPYPSAKPQQIPPIPTSRQSTIKRQDSRQFRKLSLQEQRKISTGALVSSGTEVSARGGMRRRSIGPEPEPTYSGYDKSFSDLRSITDTMRSPAQQQLFSTDTSRTSCYSHTCKPPSYCAYSEQSVGHTMGDKDGASTVYTTQGKLFRMAQDDTDSTASSQ